MKQSAIALLIVFHIVSSVGVAADRILLKKIMGRRNAVIVSSMRTVIVKSKVGKKKQRNVRWFKNLYSLMR